MRNRQLGYQDIGKKCSFLLMASSPERNLNQINENIRAAFIIGDGYLYYMDKDQEKCVYIKMDSSRLQELKKRLSLQEGKLDKNEVRVHIDDMSSDEWEAVISQSLYFPTWLHKIIYFTNMTTNFKKEVWQMEADIRNLELSIAKLEELCVVKTKKSELENIYPSNYKQNPSVWPTDYKVIKLEELNRRLALFDNSENKKNLVTQQADIRELKSNFKNIQSRYLECVEHYQTLDTQLSDYCKDITIEDKDRIKCRSDIQKLPLASKIEAASLMPGGISLSVLIDIYLQLKKKYEAELFEKHILATKKQLVFKTFENLFEQIYGKTVKEHFKEFAKKPTDQMAAIHAEFKKLNQQFWDKKNVINIATQKHKEFDQCFRTLLYLSSSCETLRFTDKVQRLNIATAVFSLFSGDSTAIEFTQGLTATQVQNSFAVMPHSSKLVCPNEATQELWLEAIVWLYGFHQKAFSQISPEFKEGNAVKPTIYFHLGDNDDREFFKHKTPLVKWTIAQYHEQHALSLLLLLPPNVTTELLSLLSEDMQNKYKMKYEDIQKEQTVSQTIETKAISNPDHQPVAIHNSQAFNIAQSVIHPSSLFQPNTGQPILVGKGLPIYTLKTITEQSYCVQFVILEELLNKYELNKEQNSRIESLKQSILNMLESYNGKWVTYRYMPNIFGRVHSAEVSVALKNIQESAEPKEYLLELIKLWKIVSGGESKTIGPNTEAMLLNALVLLSINLEETQELKKIM